MPQKRWRRLFREGFGERVDRQARGVGRKDRLRADIGRDFFVQVGLPVDAFGDRLDDQVALAQLVEVLFVVGGLDERDLRGAGSGRGVEFLQAVERLVHVAVLVAFFGGKFEQQRLDIGVDQVRGDLRAHHARAEHRDFADMEIIVHLISPV